MNTTGPPIEAPRQSNDPPPSKPITLTQKEVEVLEAVAEGLKSLDVADWLGCSKRTVDFHLNNIYLKLRVNNRMSAVNEARRLGLMGERK